MRLVPKYQKGNKTKYASAAKDVNTGETYDVYLQDGNTYDKDGNPVSVIGIPDTVITPQTYNQYLAADSFDTKEKELEGVYPEFDIITGAGMLKDIGSLGFNLAKSKLANLPKISPKHSISLSSITSKSTSTDAAALTNYIARVKAKGGTTSDILVGDLTTEEGLNKAAEHVAKMYPSQELTQEELIEGYKNQLKEAVNNLPLGFGNEEAKLAHINQQAFNSAERPYVIIHEIEHAAHTPAEAIPEGTLNEWVMRLPSPTRKDPEYFFNDNNSEVGPRISQVLSHMGIKDAQKVTGKQLQQGFDSYLDANKLDNDMTFLRDNILDWGALAKWANNPKNVYQVAAPIGIGLPILNKMKTNDNL